MHQVLYKTGASVCLYGYCAWPLNFSSCVCMLSVTPIQYATQSLFQVQNIILQLNWSSPVNLRFRIHDDKSYLRAYVNFDINNSLALWLKSGSIASLQCLTSELCYNVFLVAFVTAICLNLLQSIVSEYTETVSNDCLVSSLFCDYRMTAFNC